MIKSQVISYWIETGDELGTIKPYFITSGGKYVDVTKEAIPLPGEPNVVVIECLVTDEQFAEIEADDNLFVLWDMPNPRPPDGVPSQAEWGLLNAHLAKPPISMTPQQRKAAIGQNPNNRNRAEISNSLKNWVRNK